jgi:carboxyl-terminal processing protease
MRSLRIKSSRRCRMRKLIKFLISIAVILWLSIEPDFTVRAQELKLKQGSEKKTEEKTDVQLYENLELFATVIDLVQREYVEDVKPKDLIYGALEGMLTSLDPYSQFLDPETYQELKVETEGEFGGIGIVIAIKDGILTIVSPLEDTPGYKAGLEAGDRIVKINGESTKGITLMEAVKKLRGKPGTEVTLTVLREKEHRLIEFKIVRDIIKIKSVKEAKVLEDNIGYIKLMEFQENTTSDFKKALRELDAKGIEGLILDLRNNPGGLLDVAVDVTSEFLPQGKLIVYTKGRSEKQNMEFKSKGGSFLEKPIIVLINKGTASGAEILSGALQDNNRAIIIGQASFGKASVQTIIPMKDGSALRLTTAHYYTPDGNLISEKGIQPDIVVKETKTITEKETLSPEEVFEQIEKGKEEGIPLQKEKKIDPVLEKAVEIMKGLIKYRKMLTTKS